MPERWAVPGCCCGWRRWGSRSSHRMPRSVCFARCGLCASPDARERNRRDRPPSMGRWGMGATVRRPAFAGAGRSGSVGGQASPWGNSASPMSAACCPSCWRDCSECSLLCRDRFRRRFRYGATSGAQPDAGRTAAAAFYRAAQLYAALKDPARVLTVLQNTARRIPREVAPLPWALLRSDQAAYLRARVRGDDQSRRVPIWRTPRPPTAMR